MRCKPGDLAIVVRSEGPNLGVIVHVDERLDGTSWIVTTLTPCTVRGASGDKRHPAGTKTTCPDYMLRPIRPDAEQETRELENVT